MNWWHWVAASLMCFGGLLFFVFPDKTIWGWLFCLGIIGLGVLGCLLPEVNITEEKLYGIKKKREG